MNAEAKTIDLKPENSVVIMPETARDVSPFTLLDRALSMGADPTTLREFMALQERHEANVARKAFNEAFANFKTEAIKIVRNKLVTDGPLKGRKYAELFSFVDAVTPALSAHGLSHSWSITKDEKDWIEVTCTVEHALGGNKRVSMGGPPDTGGAKNPLQARISTVTYLEKATLKAAAGLAEQGDDDDGKGGGVPATITDAQIKELQTKIIDANADLPKFLESFNIERLDELPVLRFSEALAILNMKIAADKKKATKA